MRSHSVRLYLLVTAFSIAVLYGSTYQQFRFFTLENPGGGADAVHYVGMARGERPDETEIQHYRWVTPAAAAAVDRITSRFVTDRDLSIRLSFYLVNFAISLAGCVVLFALLRAIGFSILLSLLGICAFVTSRALILSTATPMVDAAYFCAIGIIVWLTLEQKTIALALALPILVLTKETIIPFLALPLLTGMRRSPAIWMGLAASAVTFFISRQMVEGHLAGQDASLIGAVAEHLGAAGDTVRRLFALSGVHDLHSSFSLLLPLAVVGGWLNRRHRYHEIPAFMIAILPIAVALALLSGNFGRMLFAAFPAVIAYSLIVIEHVSRERV